MFEKQIENGVNFLNANYDNWLDKINLDILDMVNEKCCILGQLNEGFYSAKMFYVLSWNECDNLGFSVPLIMNDKTDYYPILQREWTEKINELRLTPNDN
jgi:hypothetical protein